jgi:uncharacterized membrane protein YeiB
MNLTIGKTRELFFLVVAICVVVLILIGVFTWEDFVATGPVEAAALLRRGARMKRAEPQRGATLTRFSSP